MSKAMPVLLHTSHLQCLARLMNDLTLLLTPLRCEMISHLSGVKCSLMVPDLADNCNFLCARIPLLLLTSQVNWLDKKYLWTLIYSLIKWRGCVSSAQKSLGFIPVSYQVFERIRLSYKENSIIVNLD